jgi:hypothetical protein
MHGPDTIRERMKRRARLVMHFGNGCAMLGVMPFVTARPQARITLMAAVLWVVLIVAVTGAGMLLLSRRIRCPTCKSSLRNGAYDLAACPNCKTSMDAPYPRRAQG